MASTNKTSNLELSQFIATDTPTWLVDYNGDMEKIDAGVGRVEELAETASTQAVGVASGLQATNQTVTTLSGQVANVQNQANTTTASVNGINQRLGNADISGIGDGTITGAISAQNSNLEKVFVGECTLLGTLSSNSTITLNDTIKNYKWLYLEASWDSAQSNAIAGTTICPVSLFESVHIAVDSNVGVNFYNGTDRKYGYIWRISDTQVQGETNTILKIYGVK